MKKAEKMLLTAAMALALIAAGLTGCGASSGSSGTSFAETAAVSSADSGSYDRYATGFAAAGDADIESAAEETGSDSYSDSAETNDVDNSRSAVSVSDTTEDIQKKIIYNGNVYLETKDYDTARTQLDDLISRYEGFTESSDESDYGTDTQKQRSLYMTVKIPSAHFMDFMNGIGNLSGKVTSKNISSSDMTRTYSDNADRIKALETEQETLLDLLSKADSVESMIAIQKELTDVRAELAQLHHANSGIDYDVQYSSVSISMDEVVTYAPEQVSFGERLKDSFGESGEAFVNFLQGLLIGIVYVIPYIIIVIVILLIVRAIVKKRKKTREKKATDLIEKAPGKDDPDKK